MKGCFGSIQLAARPFQYRIIGRHFNYASGTMSCFPALFLLSY